MGGKLTNDYIIYETNFIVELIKHLKVFYLSDLTDYLQVHTPNQNDYNRKLLYDLEGRAKAALNCFLDQVDPLDLAINQKVCSYFIAAFKDLSYRFDELSDKNLGTLIIPLHRCFARYFIRLVMFNYFIE